MKQGTELSSPFSLVTVRGHQWAVFVPLLNLGKIVVGKS